MNSESIERYALFCTYNDDVEIDLLCQVNIRMPYWLIGLVAFGPWRLHRTCRIGIFSSRVSNRFDRSRGRQPPTAAAMTRRRRRERRRS